MVDDVWKAVCKYCGLRLGAQSGTSSLRSHIATTCPAIGDDDRNHFLATIKKKSSDTFVFDPVLSHERMVQFVIHAEIEFNKFEDPYFEPWMETLQPTMKCVGRQTVRNDCLKMYEKMKQDLHNEFSVLDSRVCFTSDMWTSLQNLGYMVITAHYVDADFKLKKKIISLKEVKYPHTGYALEEAIVSSLTEWGLREKILTLTLDNAGNNTKACELIVQHHKHELLCEGAHLHVRCSAHILNILVQDGMELIHAAIEKIRELLKSIESSPSRIQNFNSIATNKGLKAKCGIYLDIPNRWNSTFRMVREALDYKSVLSTYAEQYLEVAPNEEEWSKAEAICVFLKAFEEATNLVSADRKPTSHKFLPLVLSIRYALNDPAWQNNEVLVDLAAAMKVKFAKYWEPKPVPNESSLRRRKEYDFNIVIVIATILDPRRKFDYVEFFYEKVCSNFDQAEKCTKSAQDWLKKYFNEYERLARSDGSAFVSSSSGSTCTVGSPVLGKRVLEEEFADFKSRRRVVRRPKSEIDTYLEEDPAEDSKRFDVLGWWKARADQFPVLSTMARDFLAIPLSTVSSESAFSCGNRILGDTRGSLTPQMLEALVSAKDWLTIVQDKDKDKDDEGTHCFFYLQLSPNSA